MTRGIAYFRPSTIHEAVNLLSQGGPAARAFSGGTDLIVHMRELPSQVEAIVDVKALPETNQLGFSSSGDLLLGAAVPCNRICDSPEVARLYPALSESASSIGGIQIRSRASLGGNLCNASPAADSIPTLLVLKATCHIAGPTGNRTLPAERFCTGPGQNALQQGELLIFLSLPAPAARSGAAFLRFAPREEMDIAVVNAAAYVELDAGGAVIADARVAVGAVAPTPILVTAVKDALVSRPVDGVNWDDAVAAVRAAAQPISDTRGLATQRNHLAEVLTRRALSVALSRARGAT